MAITFSDLDFQGPYELRFWIPPPEPGVYVIVVSDPKMKPLPFRLAYVDETENFSKFMPMAHSKYATWLLQCRTGGKLHIATLALPESASAQRQEVVKKILAGYRPPCNT